jgi:hypothetical protein
MMDMRLSVTSPLSSRRWDVRSGPNSWDRGLQTSAQAHIGLAPLRAHEDKVLRDGLHRPGPYRGSGAATCGSQTPMGLSLQLASGARTPLFLRDGVRRRHVLPRWQLQGRPCHVPMAEGPPRDASPTTALNAGRWAGCAQVKAWSAQLTPR